MVDPQDSLQVADRMRCAILGLAQSVSQQRGEEMDDKGTVVIPPLPIDGVGVLRYPSSSGHLEIEQARLLAKSIGKGTILCLPGTRDSYGDYLWDFRIEGGDPGQVRVERSVEKQLDAPATNIKDVPWENQAGSIRENLKKVAEASRKVTFSRQGIVDATLDATALQGRINEKGYAELFCCECVTYVAPIEGDRQTPRVYRDTDGVIKKASHGTVELLCPNCRKILASMAD